MPKRKNIKSHKQPNPNLLRRTRRTEKVPFY